jgi:hypothetical protein
MNNRFAVINQTQVKVYEGRTHLATFERDLTAPLTAFQVEDARKGDYTDVVQVIDVPEGGQGPAGVPRMSREVFEVMIKHMYPSFTERSRDEAWKAYQSAFAK